MAAARTPTSYTKDVARKLSETLQITHKDAALYTSEVVKVIAEELLAGNKVNLSELGIFTVKDVKERMVRNPKSGEMLQKAAYRKLTFRAGKHFKVRLG